MDIKPLGRVMQIKGSGFTTSEDGEVYKERKAEGGRYSKT
jgi:hypothetical protein